MRVFLERVGKMGRLVIDEETGQILKTLKEGDRILSGKSIDYLNDTKVFNHGEKYASLYNYIIQPLLHKLSNAELKFVVALLPYIQYKSYMIAYQNGVFLTRKTISKIMKLDITGVDRILSKLTELKIIGKWKTGFDIKYFANPYVFKVGGRGNKTLDAMFGNSDWIKYFEE